MAITAGRRKWLAERLRQVAAEEGSKGIESVATDFRQKAQALEAGLDPGTRAKERGRTQFRPPRRGTPLEWGQSPAGVCNTSYLRFGIPGRNNCGATMNIPPERRKWLAERMRQIAAEEEAVGAKAVAEDFRRRARDVEAGNDPLNEG